MIQKRKMRQDFFSQNDFQLYSSTAKIKYLLY